MAKGTVINIKTNKEHKVSDVDAFLKRFRGAFKRKPSIVVSADVSKKEAEIEAKNIEVKDAKVVKASKESNSKK